MADYDLVVTETGTLSDEYVTSPYVAYTAETITAPTDTITASMQAVVVAETGTISDEYDTTPAAESVEESFAFSETSTGTHTLCDTCDVDIDLPMFTMDLDLPAGGAGIVAMQLPRFTADNFNGTGGLGSGEIILTQPEASNDGFQYNSGTTPDPDDPYSVAPEFPMFRITGDLEVGGMGTGAFSLPVPEVYGEEQIGWTEDITTVPMFEIEGTATNVEAGSGPGTSAAGIELPVFTLSGSGLADGIGTVNVGLFDQGRYLEITAIGTSYGGTGTGTLPALSIAGRGASGLLGTAEFDLPILTAAAAGANLAVSGSGDFDLPQALVFAVGVSTQVRTAGLNEVVFAAMNTKTGSVSEYSSFNINSLALAGTSLIGGSTTGIYLIGAETDDGDEIPVSLRKTYLGQETPEEKRITDMYVYAEAEEDYSVDALADGAAFPVGTTVARDGYHTGKANMPRGLKGRAVGFGISGDGSPKKVDQIDLVLEIMDRRLR